MVATCYWAIAGTAWRWCTPRHCQSRLLKRVKLAGLETEQEERKGKTRHKSVMALWVPSVGWNNKYPSHRRSRSGPNSNGPRETKKCIYITTSVHKVLQSPVMFRRKQPHAKPTSWRILQIYMIVFLYWKHFLANTILSSLLLSCYVNWLTGVLRKNPRPKANINRPFSQT